jgi:hypothetical protein
MYTLTFIRGSDDGKYHDGLEFLQSDNFLSQTKQIFGKQISPRPHAKSVDTHNKIGPLVCVSVGLNIRFLKIVALEYWGMEESTNPVIFRHVFKVSFPLLEFYLYSYPSEPKFYCHTKVRERPLLQKLFAVIPSFIRNIPFIYLQMRLYCFYFLFTSRSVFQFYEENT